MKKSKQNQGITLVALVVTIVVLIILAVISINVVFKEDGIIKRAEQAKQYYEEAEVREQEQSDELVNEIYKIGEKKVTDYVQVGDYVAYEPTKSDVAKTVEVESSKLIYTSPVGGYSSSEGKITHGNGEASQVFTAKTNENLKWRVLSVAEDKIELISEEVVKTDAGGNFILKGGIAYLYAEQELNEVSKIYGYGYGAETTQITTYKIGGPTDETTGTITGSGARSITVEDINKLANITEEDFKLLDSNYGNIINETTAVYYPILTSSNKTYPGQSTDKKTGDFIYTKYNYTSDKITNTIAKDMLFNGRYWLASRCISNDNDTSSANHSDAHYRVRFVEGNKVGDYRLCEDVDTYLQQVKRSDWSVRPIVNLKPSVIDLDEEEGLAGTSSNPWKLK